MNGTVITICPFFRTDVHGLISDSNFSRGLELQSPGKNKNENKNKNKSISCFDIDPDDLDYNEDEKLILCFDFR